MIVVTLKVACGPNTYMNYFKLDWSELSKLIITMNLDLLEEFTEIWPNIDASNLHVFVSKTAS
jgi:hypothetical protein